MSNGFGKYFQKAFTGSMFGAGADVFALWGYCIANAMPPDGVLELNPIAISPMLGMSVPAVESAIEYLNAPDKRSRSPDKDGRRIVYLDSFEYQLVNFKKYRNSMDQDSMRIYHREKQRKYREKHQCSATVFDNSAIIPQAEVRSRGQKQKQSEEKNCPPVAVGRSDFDVFWSLYPRKQGKGSARVSFQRRKCSAIMAKIELAIERQKTSEQWKKDGGQFVPMPSTWINQERWDDEVQPQKAAQHATIERKPRQTARQRYDTALHDAVDKLGHIYATKGTEEDIERCCAVIRDQYRDTLAIMDTAGKRWLIKDALQIARVRAK